MWLDETSGVGCRGWRARRPLVARGTDRPFEDVMVEGEELGAIARRVIDSNQFMTVGGEEEGVPWISPAWYALAEYREIFWVSDPEARHSRNIAARPRRASCLRATTSGPKRCRDRHAASRNTRVRMLTVNGDRLAREEGKA